MLTWFPMRSGRDGGSCLSKGRKFLTVAEPVLSLHPYCCGRLFALLASTEHTVSTGDILHASNFICGVCFLWSRSFDKPSAKCMLTVIWWSVFLPRTELLQNTRRVWNRVWNISSSFLEAVGSLLSVKRWQFIICERKLHRLHEKEWQRQRNKATVVLFHCGGLGKVIQSFHLWFHSHSTVPRRSAWRSLRLTWHGRRQNIS